MIFTVEETSIVNSLSHNSREVALFDIAGELPMIHDEELKRVYRETTEKLKSMTDEEFDSMDFTIDVAR